MKLYSGFHKPLLWTLIFSCTTSYGAGLKEKLCATFSCCCLCHKKLEPLRPPFNATPQQSQSHRKNSQSPDSNSQSDGSSDSDLSVFNSVSPIFKEIVIQQKPLAEQFDITDMGGRPAKTSPHNSDNEGQ
jgi:hypothetical protein